MCLAAAIQGCAPSNSGDTLPSPAEPAEGAPTSAAAAPDGMPSALPISSTATITSVNSIWFINPADNAIVRVDPRTSRVAAVIQIEGVPLEVTNGPEGVFATILQTGDQAGILQIDPQTNRVSGILPLPYNRLKGLALIGGSLWTTAEPASSETDEKNPPSASGVLIQMDPLALSLITTFPLVYRPDELDAGLDGSLWILEDTGTASRFTSFDPAARQSRTIPGEQTGMEYAYQLKRFVASEDWLWGISILNQSRFIYRIHPADGSLDKIIEMGSSDSDIPVDICTSSGRTWAALKSQVLVEIENSSGSVIRAIPLEFQPDRLFYEDGSIWVQSHASGALAKIDAEKGALLARITTGSRLSPTPTPQPELAPGEVCQGDYPTTLQLDGRAKVSPDPPQPNRVRAEPSLKGKIFGELQPGEGMTLIEGPVCTDGWIWWKILSDDHRLTGWMAEGDGDMYWMIPD